MSRRVGHVLVIWGMLAVGAAAEVPSASAAQTVQGGAGAEQIQPAPTPSNPTPDALTLPRQAQPPRTFRAYWHVFIAFALTWILLFGYVLFLGRRFSRLEREVEALRHPG